MGMRLRDLARVGAALALLGLACPALAQPTAMVRTVSGRLPNLQLSPLALSRHKHRKKAAPPVEPPPVDATIPPPDMGANPEPEPAIPPAPTPDKPAEPPDVPAAAPSPAAAAPSQGGDDMNFDLLGTAKPHQQTAEEARIERAAATRRTMLTIHQTAGLVTLAALAATVIVGQLNYSDKFSDVPNNSGRWEQAHSILAFTTVAGFTATGLLGLFAPKPYDQPVRADTTLAHKLLMGAATLGMVSEMGLGIYTASHEGLANQKSIAQAHQVIGFSTLLFMGAGASAFLF
jgi:cytochrome b561